MLQLVWFAHGQLGGGWPSFGLGNFIQKPDIKIRNTAPSGKILASVHMHSWPILPQTPDQKIRSRKTQLLDPRQAESPPWLPCNCAENLPNQTCHVPHVSWLSLQHRDYCNDVLQIHTFLSWSPELSCELNNGVGQKETTLKVDPTQVTVPLSGLRCSPLHVLEHGVAERYWRQLVAFYSAHCLLQVAQSTTCGPEPFGTGTKKSWSSGSHFKGSSSRHNPKPCPCHYCRHRRGLRPLKKIHHDLNMTARPRRQQGPLFLTQHNINSKLKLRHEKVSLYQSLRIGHTKSHPWMAGVNW